MSQAELVVEVGSLMGQRFLLEDGATVTLGRGTQNDIQLPDRGVSRHHCRIKNEGGRPTITDLGSSNGTLVDNDVVAEGILRDGVLIQLGATSLRFHHPPLIASTAPRPLESNTVVTLVPGQDLARNLFHRRYDPTAVPLAELPAETRELARVRQGLTAICRLAAAIHGEVGLETIFGLAADMVLRVSGADHSAILMFARSTEHLESVALRRADPHRAEEEFRISNTIVQETLRQGTSLISQDAADDERFRDRASIVSQNIRSAMCVPLRTPTRVIGALYVDSRKKERSFDEADLAFLATVGQQVGVAVERARLVNDLENLFVGSMRSIVASLEAKDPYTRGHSEAVTALALLIARELSLPTAERDIIELAGLFHDVGKIGIAESVLRKAGALTPEEFGHIRSHPGIGAGIIENLPEIDRIVCMSDIVEAIRSHHERFDGKGYPAGLEGEQISRAARILAVADTFHAITSNRPYRPCRSGDEAMKILKEGIGRQHDPEVVEAFARLYAAGQTANPVVPGDEPR